METSVDNNSSHRRLEFYVPQKSIFNINMNIKHFMQKAKMVDVLRTMGARKGAEEHPERVTVERRLDSLKQERRLASRRNSAMRKMSKAGAAQEDIDRALDEISRDLAPETPSNDLKATPLFNTFRIVMTAYPPTRRRLDPPNLYPTLKALVDGLTDACWWEDDDFTHLVETSFRYGGLSDMKGDWKIVLDIYEVDKNVYVTTA